MSTLTGCIPSDVLFFPNPILDNWAVERYNNTEHRPYCMKGVLLWQVRAKKEKTKTELS